MTIGALVTVPVKADPPLVREHYSGTDSWSISDCGFPIDVEVTFSGLLMLKSGHHGDPTPYYFDNFWANFLYTNPETGKWFTVVQHGMYKDLRIFHVGGTIYRFDAIFAGVNAVVRGMDGNLVFRDRGLLHLQFSVDTKGDSDLSNDEFASDVQVVERGKHPFGNSDFCAVAGTLLL